MADGDGISGVGAYGVLEPWYFCKEAQTIYREQYKGKLEEKFKAMGDYTRQLLEFSEEAALAIEALDEAIPNGESSGVSCSNPTIPDEETYTVEAGVLTEFENIKKFIEAMCPNCLADLPFLHDEIMQGTKFESIGSCCGSINMCEIIDLIQHLRPVTWEKLQDPVWQSQVSHLNDLVCCLKRVLRERRVKDTNTYSAITEIPNYTITGLPGFKYPNYRIPPLIRMHRPLNPFHKSGNEVGVSISTGGGIGTGTGIGDLSLEAFVNVEIAFNTDVVSKVTGVDSDLFMNFAFSPLEPIYDFICNGKPFKIAGGNKPGFSPDIGASFAVQLPNLGFTPHIHMNIDPCISQFLPPMALPTIELPSLTLGGGIEFGIYANNILGANNFGTGFSGIGGFTMPDIQLPKLEIPSPSFPFKHGMKVDVNFPDFGKGTEWSIEDE